MFGISGELLQNLLTGLEVVLPTEFLLVLWGLMQLVCEHLWTLENHQEMTVVGTGDPAAGLLGTKSAATCSVAGPPPVTRCSTKKILRLVLDCG